MNDLLKEAAVNAEKAEKLRGLVELYPDIRKVEGRWNWVRYATPVVNGEVDDYEMRHTCGCCSDAAIEIWPFKATPFGKVSCYPAYFWIGSRDIGRTSDLEPMRKAGLPEALIQRLLDRYPLQPERDEPEF